MAYSPSSSPGSPAYSDPFADQVYGMAGTKPDPTGYYAKAQASLGAAKQQQYNALTPDCAIERQGLSTTVQEMKFQSDELLSVLSRLESVLDPQVCYGANAKMCESQVTPPLHFSEAIDITSTNIRSANRALHRLLDFVSR